MAGKAVSWFLHRYGGCGRVLDWFVREVGSSPCILFAHECGLVNKGCSCVSGLFPCSEGMVLRGDLSLVSFGLTWSLIPQGMLWGISYWLLQEPIDLVFDESISGLIRDGSEYLCQQ